MGGGESSWRIVVRIGVTHPELQGDLAPLPSRARAERLRQLALVGLHCLRAGSIPTKPAKNTAETDNALTARRDRLLRSLGADAE
jgi:hypothetical protein